jgi:predicted helicase
VLSTDPAVADTLARDGGLGDTEAFRAAVADPDDAGVIGFVGLGALIDEVIAQGGDSAAEAEEFAAVSALGFSATSSGDEGRFVLRITTR